MKGGSGLIKESICIYVLLMNTDDRVEKAWGRAEPMVGGRGEKKGGHL